MLLECHRHGRLAELLLGLNHHLCSCGEHRTLRLACRRRRHRLLLLVRVARRGLRHLCGCSPRVLLGNL